MDRGYRRGCRRRQPDRLRGRRGGIGDDSLVGGSGGRKPLWRGRGGYAGRRRRRRPAGRRHGANRLIGGDGDDTYVVTSATDIVIEAADWGNDIVYASVSFTLGDNVETLNLAGAGAIDGTGNALGNRIVGGTGDNVLRGLAGDDVLVGGDGADTLVGGAGADQLIGGAGADVIVYSTVSDSTLASWDAVLGFTGGQDRMDLSAIGTGMGGWAAEAFVTGTAFTAAHQVAWSASSGLLRVDTDGDLATAEMVIRFALGTTLAESDLILV